MEFRRKGRKRNRGKAPAPRPDEKRAHADQRAASLLLPGTPAPQLPALAGRL